MGQAVEQSSGEPLVAEDAGPLVEGQVRGDDRGAALVALADELEEELGAGLRQGYEAEFVDDEQLASGELPLKAEQSLVVLGLDHLVE